MNKSVPVIANAEAEDRCLVRILDFYASIICQREGPVLFYIHMKPTSPWFKNQVMSKNTLGSIVKSVCMRKQG